MRKLYEKPKVMNFCFPSKKYKAVYFKIPKNASTAMYHTLNEVGFFDLCKWNISDAFSKEDVLKDFNDYYKFVIVRNPFDRLASAYINRITQMKLIPEAFWRLNSFEAVIRKISIMKNKDIDQHFRPQHTFVDGVNIDLVVKLEDMSRLYNDVNLPFIKKVVQRKASNKGDYRQYYNKELRQLVEKKFKKDLLLFNYEF